MRCPYCGGLNQERAVFCVNCGRDLRRAQQNVQPQRPPAQTPQQPGYSTNQPNRGANQPVQPSHPAQPQTQATAAASRRQPTAASRTSAPTPFIPAPPAPEPEPPGPFPPRTLAQFTALLPGCQAYTVTESHVENGRKIVSIVYPRCANWQQAATLLKALKEHQEEKYATTVVRGTFVQRQDVYEFTNGQIQFDRGVRLGARICNRYTLETGNGYSVDSIRFVLNE